MPVQTDTRSGIKHGFDTGQDGWGGDVNKNFQILALERNILILNTGVNTPPTNPTENDCYAVGGAPTGDWTGWAQNSLAVWGHSASGGALAWINVIPKEGWTAYNANSSEYLVYDNNVWSSSGVQADVDYKAQKVIKVIQVQLANVDLEDKLDKMALV